MYLLLERPGAPPQRIKVDDNAVLVGRAPTCDVVIDEEFVSKQHLRILRGLVAIDMSSNGTFVDGERIHGGLVLDNQALRIACSDITLRVEQESAPSAAAAASPVPPPLAAPTPATPAPAGTGESAAIALLRRELQALSKTLKDETDTRARLATEVEQAQKHAEALRADNVQLRARIQQSAQSEPEVAPPPADASAASLLLFKLQRENAQLKRALAEATAGPAAPAASPPIAGPQQPVPAAAPSPQPDAQSTPADRIVPVARDAVSPARDAGPTPAAAARPAGVFGISSSLALTRLTELVQKDAKATVCRTDDPLDAFLMVEGFRFLRRLEKVITRFAGGLIQLYQLHTMVPGVAGNLRELLGATLADPGRTSGREELLDYVRELGRWAVVALSAYRKAAEGFALQLKDELSPEALTRADPIPVMKKMSGKMEAELWRRVTAHLRTLSPDTIAERLEKLAREAADELSKGESVDDDVDDDADGFS